MQAEQHQPIRPRQLCLSKQSSCGVVEDFSESLADKMHPIMGNEADLEESKQIHLLSSIRRSQAANLAESGNRIVQGKFTAIL